jgi:hypothetical protein
VFVPIIPCRLDRLWSLVSLYKIWRGEYEKMMEIIGCNEEFELGNYKVMREGK